LALADLLPAGAFVCLAYAIVISDPRDPGIEPRASCHFIGGYAKVERVGSIIYSPSIEEPQ
jgi:hypothetical protein